MFGLWTVARLASYVRVLSLSAHFRLIVVTHHALILAGIRNRPLSDLVERARPKVAVLTKILRDHHLAQSQKQRQPRNDYDRRPDEVR